MRSSRAALRTVLALALPVLLLGAGWLWSSVRARDARLADERARLAASLDRARSAVDAGLRELIAREDERPFYVYSHYYSPPDVLALTDPVAISPLALETGDPRIVGWFELDPDGTVRTPYAVEPGPVTDRATRVLARLDADTRALLLAELEGGRAGDLIASTPTPLAVPQAQVATPPPRAHTRIAATTADAGAPVAIAIAEPPPPVTDVGPPELSTNMLAQVGNSIATDITQAQSGDVEAYERVQSRGRAVPRVSRRDVQRESVVPESPAQAEPVRRAARSVPPAPPPPAPSLPPLVQGEIEVDYQPMAVRSLPNVLLLTRIVSHGDDRVLDGVVLDVERIVGPWMEETIAHAVATDAPRVLAASDTATECAERVAASDLLPGVDLCAPTAPLARAERETDAALRVEMAILVLLLVLSGLAVVLVLRAARRAEELARQKSAFVSAVSHELRTPLTTLRMHAEMLDEGLVTADRQAKVHAELVTESVRLARLVENVLEISRLEEGRRPLRATRADLGRQVDELVRSEAPRARAKGFTLEARLPDDAIELPFDAPAIERILVNAIDNALKYAGSADEKRIEVSLAREAKEGRPGVCLRVRDHGPGIPARERERVFERFYRVERPESAHQPGTGLGLALVRELARAHGGDAEILDGAPGTIVAVWLPLA